ncbi:MAG: Glycerol-3-phosphate dehydrogenase [Labilithrix sp.]|nr:Glycerol-3-phosphate dehydrogenase [Labilithrix sp.]
MSSPGAPRKVAVIGGGAWGTALAAHAARQGHDAMLWAREPDVVLGVNEAHENRLFLEGVALPPGLRASSSPVDVARGAELVVLVPPSAFLGTIAGLFAEHIEPGARIVIATKGIDEHTGALMTEVAARAMPRHDAAALCVLSGPSFAREVAAGLPTDVVVASRSDEALADVASALHSPFFRVYTSKDPVGVEVGGAMKNVLAIAAGACDGLGLGTNARAALVTRGLSEMARLGVALGGDPLTFMGLSGVGDLILTSTGALSRNRALGMKIAEGIEPSRYVAEQRTVAEGYLTARAAYRLAQKVGVEVPITEQVYLVLHEGRPLLEAMKTLMHRAQKRELWGLPG